MKTITTILILIITLIGCKKECDCYYYQYISTDRDNQCFNVVYINDCGDKITECVFSADKYNICKE